MKSMAINQLIETRSQFQAEVLNSSLLLLSEIETPLFCNISILTLQEINSFIVSKSTNTESCNLLVKSSSVKLVYFRNISPKILHNLRFKKNALLLHCW